MCIRDRKTTNAVPTADYINIQVDAAVNVKISSEPSRLALAAQNFLNQNTQYIASIAREVLEGNMRAVSYTHLDVYKRQATGNMIDTATGLPVDPAIAAAVIAQAQAAQ